MSKLGAGGQLGSSQAQNALRAMQADVPQAMRPRTSSSALGAVAPQAGMAPLAGAGGSLGAPAEKKAPGPVGRNISSV